MTRNKFFAALFAAPMAVFPCWKAKPAASQLVVKITCDTGEFEAALTALSERLAKFNPPLAADEIRGQADGLPPVIVKMNGEEVSRIYPFS